MRSFGDVCVFMCRRYVRPPDPSEELEEEEEDEEEEEEELYRTQTNGISDGRSPILIS